MALKRSAFSNRERLALRAEHKKRPKASQNDLCQWFEGQFRKSIKQSTVCEILSTRWSHLESSTALNPVLDSRFKNIPCRWQELEAALSEWFVRADPSVTITHQLLKSKALEFWQRLPCYQGQEPPSLSNGWFYNFQRRCNLKNRRQIGQAALVEGDGVTDQITAIQLQINDFAPEDRYSCDETGLCHKLQPGSSLSAQQCGDHNLDTSRLSILLCCNATGSHKLKPWIIGKFKNPRCFFRAGVPIKNMNCVYRSNPKAWMSTIIFEQWLRWFDSQMNGRKVVLLMDDISAHAAALSLVQGQLSNTSIIFLPPNSTSKTQPLNQGIIRTFKAYYRQSWLQYTLDEYQHQRDAVRTVDTLKVMRWTIRAWIEIQPSAIAHCWQHCLLYTANLVWVSSAQCELPRDLQEQLELELKHLKERHLIPPTMDVEQLLCPQSEVIEDTDQDGGMVERFEQLEDDPEDTAGEDLLKITTEQALRMLNSLRLHEEQSDDCSQTFIDALYKHEQVLRSRQFEESRQVTR